MCVGIPIIVQQEDMAPCRVHKVVQQIVWVEEVDAVDQQDGADPHRAGVRRHPSVGIRVERVVERIMLEVHGQRVCVKQNPGAGLGMLPVLPLAECGASQGGGGKKGQRRQGQKTPKAEVHHQTGFLRAAVGSCLVTDSFQFQDKPRGTVGICGGSKKGPWGTAAGPERGAGMRGWGMRELVCQGGCLVLVVHDLPRPFSFMTEMVMVVVTVLLGEWARV